MEEPIVVASLKEFVAVGKELEHLGYYEQTFYSISQRLLTITRSLYLRKEHQNQVYPYLE